MATPSPRVMDAAGNASYPVTIAKDMSSASAYYTDETSAPSVTLTATSGMMDRQR